MKDRKTETIADLKGKKKTWQLSVMCNPSLEIGPEKNTLKEISGTIGDILV